MQVILKYPMQALALAGAVLAMPAQAAVQFGFDTDAQGWTVSATGAGGPDATLVWVAGGAHGGYLRLDDLTTATDFLLLAPASLRGNLSAYLGGTLSFDAINLDGVAPDWPEFGQITLTSGSTVLSIDGVAAGQPPIGGQWHRYTVPLTTSVFGSGLAGMLANVDSLSIKAEFHQGLGDAIGIDNISVSAVPEPASWAMLAVGGLLLAARRRTR